MESMAACLRESMVRVYFTVWAKMLAIDAGCGLDVGAVA